MVKKFIEMNRNWSIPPQLIDAVRKKGVTFLVGAGASQDAPAKVPAWERLAVLLDQKLGERQAFRFDSKQMRPDRYIWDRIESDPRLKGWIVGKIKEWAERKIDGNKVPSNLHRKLMRVASKWGGESVLVLTTNYDLLLEAAAEQGTDWFGSPKQWVGPTDGRAAAAKGIYHMHGTLESQKSILLTEEEMRYHYEASERKYSKYLTEIFRDRVILAIGYRFGDPEIEKILNGIGNDSYGQMYAIIEEKPGGGLPPELSDRVNAITYANGQHDEVKKILERIEDMAVTGSAVSLAKTLRDIGRNGPESVNSSIWEQIGALIRSGDINLNHFLYGTMEATNADEWICAEMLEVGLSGVFRIGELSEGEMKLCDWLSRDLTGARFKKVLWATATAGGTMHPFLQNCLGRELQDKDRNFSIQDLRLGIEVLCSQGVMGGLHDSVSFMLGLIAERVQKIDSSETETGLEVFQVLTEVVAQPYNSWRQEQQIPAAEAGVSFNAVTRSDGRRIERAWKKIGERLVENAPGELWEIASAALRKQQRITDICCGKKNSFNRWNYDLLAIEKLDELPDWNKGGRYVLLDAACRGLSKMGSTPSDKERWAASVERAMKEDSPLLRRVAVESVRTTKHWHADKKLSWAADQVRMNDWWTQHEQRLLIKELWGSVEEATRNEVANAIIKMVQITDREKHVDEISNIRRADMIIWLKEQGIEHQGMETELKFLLKNYPHIENQIGKKDQSMGTVAVSRFESISPEQADELINEWKKRGDEALDELIDWFALIDHSKWHKSPNLEGAAKVIKAAVKTSEDYGLALSRRLSKRQMWHHRGWESLTESMQMHIDTAAGRRWLEETNWEAITEANSDVDWEATLHAASKLAWDEEWSNETMQVLYRASKRAIEANGKREGKQEIIPDELHGILEQAINEPVGKAINAILALWKLQVKREKTGSASKQLNSNEMIGAVENLATQGDIRIQKFATVLLARDYRLVLEEAENVVKRVLHKRLESKESIWRDVVWEGLSYCNDWNYHCVSESLTGIMQRDLMEQNEPPGTGWREAGEDKVANKYGYSLAVKVWVKGQKYKEGWTIGEMPEKRRQAVVKYICDLFDRSEKMHTDGWEKLLVHVWEDIAGASGTKTTKSEQKALMTCFRHLKNDEQDEFATRFMTGPSVSPERLIGYHDESPNIENRVAALKILLHCCNGNSQSNIKTEDNWPWHDILDMVQKKWWGEATSEQEKDLIRELLVARGRKIQSSALF